MSIRREIPFSLIGKASLCTKILHPFRHRYSLSSQELSSQPFFIVGSGRSGNTLLRRMLMSGGEVAIPPESYILARAARKFLWFNYLSWERLSNLIVSEFESHADFKYWDLDLKEVKFEAAQLAGNSRTFANVIDLVYKQYAIKNSGLIQKWGDKTPTNALFLDHICSAFPRAYYIHIIRDPRAVFSSFCQSGLMPFATASEKKLIIDNWLDSHRKIESCKTEFKEMKYATIQYESLVTQPKSVLKEICSCLNIEFKLEMLDFWKDESVGDIKNLAHHKNTTQPISNESINKWNKEMSSSDILLVEKRCMPLYERLLELYPQ